MLYLRNKEIYYYTAEPIGEVYFDLYNFSSMTRTDEALQDMMKWSFHLYDLKGIKPTAGTRYTLELDFLANSRTSLIDKIIDRTKDYFTGLGFNPEITEVPLKLQIKDLKIEDIINLIQDNNFQALNNAISALHCTTWRLHAQ